MSIARLALSLAAAVVVASGCASRPLPATPGADTAGPPLQVVDERYVSPPVTGDELDSLVAWADADGATWVIASAKASHQLVVFDADTGARLRTVGARGTAPGTFQRPNGLAVFGDLLFVVERDNRRVQVLSLPGFAPLATFGDGLRSPYGIWLHETAPGELEVFVTDSFMDGERYDVVPPLAQLDQRVRRYRVQLDDGRVAVRALGAFGDTSQARALRMVESIAGDPAHDRLLIADEDRRHQSTLREYRMDGTATGRGLPGDTFDGEAEGIALWSCSGDGGYWIAVDQQAPRTRFHLFDRTTLAPAGSFAGRVTAQTDGIALHAAGSARFPAGVLFAVHDDRALATFDLGDVVDALGLDPACRQ